MDIETIHKGLDVSGRTNGLLSEREEKLNQLVSRRQNNLTIILENIHDPHNIHAVLRTCDAVGIPEIYVIYNKYPKKIKQGKRSSASTKKWVNIHLFTSQSECVEALKSKGFILIATHLNAEAKSLYDMDLTQKVALVFGNEQRGISKEILEHCSYNYIIPMHGMADSLNVSVAASISLYEAYRQRDAMGMYNTPQLTEDERSKLFNHYSWQ